MCGSLPPQKNIPGWWGGGEGRGIILFNGGRGGGDGSLFFVTRNLTTGICELLFNSLIPACIKCIHILVPLSNVLARIAANKDRRAIEDFCR